MVKEVLIALLGLLFIPKSVEFDISDIVGTTKFLPVTGANKLEEDKNIIYKLNSTEKSDKTIETIFENEDEIQKENKRIFIEELYSNIENIPNNLIYEDIMDSEDKIIENIYELLEKKNKIITEEVIEILEKNNNYIIKIDDSIDEIFEKDLKQIVKIINQTYKINKLNSIWEQKEIINKNKLNHKQKC